MDSESWAVGFIAGGVVLVIAMLFAGAGYANRQMTERYKACLEHTSPAECATVLR